MVLDDTSYAGVIKESRTVIMGQGVNTTRSDTSRMHPQRLEWIREVERTHFWHVPRRQLLLYLIRQRLSAGERLLDVGCGTGLLCHELNKVGIAAYGVDPGAATMNLDPERFSVGETTALPWRSQTFDMVCALDILEHVDDQEALGEIVRVLKPGGCLLASVPAYRWLWSERDVVAGHLRRYSRRSLRLALLKGGFSVNQLFGYQFVLLPLVIVSRWWQHLFSRTHQLQREDRPLPVLNRFLYAVNHFEVTLGRLKRPPFGSSLLAIASRDDSNPETTR